MPFMITGFACSGRRQPNEVKIREHEEILFNCTVRPNCLAVVAGGMALYAWHWSQDAIEMDAERIQYVVPAGSGLRQVAKVMNDAGINIHPDAMVGLARFSGLDTSIKAGTYQARQGDSPRQLLERMARGDVVLERLTLVEGWTYRQIRQALDSAGSVRNTLGDISDEELLRRLGASDHPSPEGLFMPDTYVFAPGTTDFEILQQAYQAQRDTLKRAWESRDPDLPLSSPYEALILASIVEKETGLGEDRGKVAGVFVNRLRRGMLLQTDPTVIYGMGEKYDGRIRKRDLQTDTPWNTYTRSGLPPTPIASPGKAALDATLNPESHQYFYFVARGDGSSQFSKTLHEHNRAVAKYILGRR